MKMPARLVPLAACLICLAAPLAAQSSNPMDAIRGKNALSDEDRNAVRTWVDEKVGAIVANDNQSAAAATRDLISAARSGSNAFKEAIAAAVLEAIRPAVQRSAAEAATRLTLVAGQLDSAEPVGLLIESLQDDRPAVRAAAAIGLTRLRPKIALAGGDFLTRSLNALREAAKQEKSRRTLESIYRAMDYAGIGGSGAGRDVAAALLDVLEARAELYHSSAPVPAESAETVGLAAAAAVRSAMDDAMTRRLTIAIAKMLRHGVIVYTTGEGPDAQPLQAIPPDASPERIDRRNSIERLIEEAESRLKQLLPQSGGAVPDISDAMKKADVINMKIQMDEWAKSLEKSVGQNFSL